MNPDFPVGIALNPTTPIGAIVYQLREKSLYILDEALLEASGNPLDALAILAGKYGGPKVDCTLDLSVDPNDGKVNATDATVAQNYLMTRFRSVRNRCFYKGAESRQIDAVNSVNEVLSCNSPNRLYIAQGCKRLIRDLSQMTFRQGERKLNTDDKSLGALSSCLQIVCYRLFPVQITYPKTIDTAPPIGSDGRLFWDQRHRLGKWKRSRYPK